VNRATTSPAIAKVRSEADLSATDGWGRFVGQPHRPSRRTGFSLMEVILATAILLGSVVVLSELAGMGRRQSLRGRDLAEAQQLCETTLHEILTGLRPPEPVEQEPLLPAQPLLEQSFEDETLFDLSENLDPFAFEDETVLPDQELLDEQTQTARWLHSIRVTPLEAHPGLAVLTVVVEQAPEEAARPLRFELSRWIDDPMAVEVDESGEGFEPLEIVNRGGRTP